MRGGALAVGHIQVSDRGILAPLDFSLSYLPEFQEVRGSQDQPEKEEKEEGGWGRGRRNRGRKRNRWGGRRGKGRGKRTMEGQEEEAGDEAA